MIRLLVVDDSALMRRLLTNVFEAAGGFEVEVARNGAEALAKLEEVAPDVVTLDIHMPGMDGLQCLDQIMIQRPCPVVMLSGLTAEGAEETLQAMQLGAVDFIAKPKGAISLEIENVASALVHKVRAAAGARISGAMRLRERLRARAGRAARGPFSDRPKPTVRKTPLTDPSIPTMPSSGVVLVGSSTGGPPALDALIGELPANFPWPIVIAQHMPASFTGPLARRLDRLGNLRVHEIDRPTPLLPAHAYIAHGDADILLSLRKDVLFGKPAPKSESYNWHPSVDRLVESALRIVEPRKIIGILMTGMGNDGAAAMAELNARGGYTIAEAEETAVVWGMPGSLVKLGGASSVRPLEQICDALMALFAE